MKGLKYDKGKLQYSLMPVEVLKEVVAVLTHGVKKYPGRANWKRVPKRKHRYTDAAFRHIEAWRNGDRVDKDSGKQHLAHAICCLTFLLYEDISLPKCKRFHH